MDLPLHEDDLAETGIIDPAALHPRRPDMPEAAVLCFFPEVVDGLAGEPLLTISTERGRTPVRVVEHAGERVAVVHPGVGAPLAAMFLEDVIALGVRRVVAVGGAGSLLPDLVLGHAVVVGSAVRDEGTSFHYLPPARVVDADPDGVTVLAATLTEVGLPHVVARAWTTDAVYRETRARVDRRRAEGCAVVEMEAAALIAVARSAGSASPTWCSRPTAWPATPGTTVAGGPPARYVEDSSIWPCGRRPDWVPRRHDRTVSTGGSPGSGRRPGSGRWPGTGRVRRWAPSPT